VARFGQDLPSEKLPDRGAQLVLSIQHSTVALSMQHRGFKFGAIAAGIPACVLLVLPWVVYFVGLANIVGLPAPPTVAQGQAIPLPQLWEKLKDRGPVEVERQSPYGYVGMMLGTRDEYAGERLVWFVARDYNATHLQSQKMGWWHLSGAAMSIWLTRNWTTEQLAIRAHELLAAHEAHSGG
jgi:hypothetical protein